MSNEDVRQRANAPTAATPIHDRTLSERLIDRQNTWVLRRDGLGVSAELQGDKLVVYYDPTYRLVMHGGHVRPGNTGKLLTKVEIAPAPPEPIPDAPPTGMLQEPHNKPTELQPVPPIDRSGDPKACPFCAARLANDGEVSVCTYGQDTEGLYVQVTCAKCGARGPMVRLTEKGGSGQTGYAVKVWNDRSLPARLGATRVREPFTISED